MEVAMPRKPRLTQDNSNFQSLRSSVPSSNQSLHNVLCVGLLVAHLIEREYAVYTKVTQAQELVIRIYDGEDKYELLIYPYEDAREVISGACGKLGGKEDLVKLLSRVDIFVETLLAS
jgi:hypothetical protein